MAIVVNKNVTSGEMPLQIPDGAVTTAKIADEAVTTAKIDDGAVTADKIDFSTMKFPVPDYANGIAFNTTSYTCPANGFVSVRADVQRTGTAGLAQMKVEVQRGATTYSVELPAVYFDSTGYNHFYPSSFFPVAKGDTVKLSSDASATSWIDRDFYPAIYV